MLASVLKIHSKVNPDEGKNVTQDNSSEKRDGLRPSQRIDTVDSLRV